MRIGCVFLRHASKPFRLIKSVDSKAATSEGHRSVRWYVFVLAGVSKILSSEAATSEEARRTLVAYGESRNDVRTKLEGFFRHLS